MRSGATSASIPSPTAARGSRCRLASWATVVRPCAAAPSSREARDDGAARRHRAPRRRHGRGGSRARRQSRGTGDVHLRRSGEGAPRQARARHVHRRAGEVAVRRSPHQGRHEHSARRAPGAALRGSAHEPGHSLLSVPACLGPGGQRGAVGRRLPQHADPQRGYSRLVREGLPHRRDGEAVVPEAARLAHAAREGLALVTAQPGVIEAEVFVADNRSLLTRLNYTSHIPCNGVEEPKSTETYGLGIQASFASPDGVLLGFGSEPSDLSPAGVARALDKARRGAVRDPEFRSLPRPGAARRVLVDYHDPALLAVDDAQLVECGWKVLQGGLNGFLSASRLGALAGSDEELRKLGLILGGDVTIVQESVAIASTAMPEPQVDVTTLIMSFVTGMVESRDAKGSGWSTGTRLADLTEEAGADAARRAVEAIGGERVPTGDYTVIFGRQPITDLMNNLVVPSCQAGSFYASSTAFLGKLGKAVASPRLSIYDEGAMPGLMGSKGITCEGLPTGRTDLIRDGVLVGALASWYEAQRLLHDPALKEKLGVDASEAAHALVARSGFRTGSGGRAFDTQPETSATNVVIAGSDPVSLDELIRTVRDGLYVGRIWYTYPINGLRAGDFTCTVVGDSFIIRDGRIAAPLKANTVRINDNITRVLQHVVGITKDTRGTLVWAAEEVVYTPEIAVTSVHVDAIAGFMEALA